MKTCITAPEPIEAYYNGARMLVVAATASKDYGLEIHVVESENRDASIFTDRARFFNPSPALLAFIAKAEAELLPKKLRSVGELTRGELLDLMYEWCNSAGSGEKMAACLERWATENNIQLPEAG